MVSGSDSEEEQPKEDSLFEVELSAPDELVDSEPRKKVNRVNRAAPAFSMDAKRNVNALVSSLNHRMTRKKRV